MSIVFTKHFEIQCSPEQRLWTALAQKIGDLGLPGVPLRLILTRIEDNRLIFECSFLETDRTPVWPSLLQLDRRPRCPQSAFNVVSIIPTGVRAEVGGFAGDGTPATNLLAKACDYLIVNPNSVTASDVYFAGDNVLYLEGNLICHLMLGHLALIPRRRSRLGVIIEKPRQEKFFNNVLNAVNALRAVGGITIDPVVVTQNKFETRCVFSEFGNASGSFDGIDELIKALDVVQQSGVDAVGLSTTLLVDDDVIDAYYRGEPIPNPWGGAEAILTHMTTNFFPFTAAHSPLLIDDFEETRFGTLVDPRDGAELISSSYFCSCLKGLTRSPQPVPFDRPLPPGTERIGVDTIQAVVMPASTTGNIPFFAALEQNVPLILVQGNPTQYQITPEALGIDHKCHKIYYVNSYLEAAGLLLALRHGLAPEATLRPLPQIEPIFL